MSKEELKPQYNPTDIESAIYRKWEKSEFFNPDRLSLRSTKTRGKKRKKAFTIALPPPNVTGSLHMGHALNAVIQDILVRKKRMEGCAALWIPGTDHAGIATQNAVEKELKKEGLTRHDLGRERFIARVWEWKEKYGNIIFEQYRKIGASLDWSRTRFTMDPDYQKAVKEAFIHYYNKGWIYRGERVISWCTRCRTSLSDLELEYKEEKGMLWHIKYPIKNSDGYIVVATTRPETMLGDTAVAVNPKDARYKNVVGKDVLLPIAEREIPVVADRRVDMAFGTGAVKVTPAHDALDEQIGREHQLSFIAVIGEDGKMTKRAGEAFAGMPLAAAREKIVALLTEQGIIEKIEPYTHNVARCYRCDTAIEPLLSMQWFVKMEELAAKARGTVRAKKVRFHPPRWEKVYRDWLGNIRDWCISRQLWWGA